MAQARMAQGSTAQNSTAQGSTAQGWHVDVAGAQAVVERTARAGTTAQAAALDVDRALQAVVGSLAGTASAGAAQSFRAARRDDAPAVVRGVVAAVTAAAAVADAVAEADAEMADRTTAAGSSRGAGVR